MFKVTARDQGHYKGPSGAFVTYCNISCFFYGIMLVCNFQYENRVSSVTFKPLKIFSQNMVQILYQSVDYIGSLAKFT